MPDSRLSIKSGKHCKIIILPPIALFTTMAFPATNTVTTTTNDHEYDAKAHTEYDIHRRRAHKLSDAKSHKARVTSKSDRAWRATPRPPVNLRHIRRRSAVFEDDDDDFGDDDSEPVDSDGGDDPPEIQTHGESHPVEDVATLSDLIARQTRQRGTSLCRLFNLAPVIYHFM